MFNNRILQYFFVLSVVINCSTIEIDRNSSAVIDSPELPFNIDESNFDRFSYDSNDCRLDKSPNSKIIFYFSKPEFPRYVNDNWIKLFIDFQIKLYQTNNSEIEIDDYEINSDIYKENCRLKKFDIAIQTFFFIENEEIRIRQDYLDSYNSKFLGSIEYNLNSIEKYPKNNGMFEFAIINEKIVPIKISGKGYLEFKKYPDYSILNSLIENQQSSYLKIYSGELGTEIYLNNKKIGKMKIENYRSRRGLIKVEFRKKGKVQNGEINIYLRGGESKNIVDPFNLQNSTTTLYLSSIPINLPVFRDGINIGSTPFLISNISPGEKFISIQETGNYKLNIKKGRDNILIRPNSLKNVYDSSILWNSKNLFNITLDLENHFSIMNNSKGFLDKWNGIESFPLSEGNLKISGEFLNSIDRGLGEILLGIYNEDICPSIHLNEEKINIFDFKIKNNNLFSIIQKDLNSKIKFQFEINNKKKEIILSINSKEIIISKYKEFGEMKIYISVKGQIYNKINILDIFNVQYF